MDAKRVIIVDEKIKIIKLKVKVGTMVYDGRILLIYEPISNATDVEGEKENQKKLLKSTEAGKIRKILVKEGEILAPGSEIIELEKECNHPTVIRDLCAQCGADLQKENRKEGTAVSEASVSMIHMVPDLKVNTEIAQRLGKADMDRLLDEKKLVLLVDLDQTLIHTTNDNIPNNIKDVYHFQLEHDGLKLPWYHTRLRPGTHNFLHNISKKYELHICTFGSRRYAHTIARILDEDGKIFSHRILSRDECFDPNSKTANLKALFPCGENMVCIIDDREDVWEYASNLIHVKPYHFFQHTGDIHAPPGLTKCENDDNKQGFDFTQLENSSNTSESSVKLEEDSSKNSVKNESDEIIGDTEKECSKNEGNIEKNTSEQFAPDVPYSSEVLSNNDRREMFEKDVSGEQKVTEADESKTNINGVNTETNSTALSATDGHVEKGDSETISEESMPNIYGPNIENNIAAENADDLVEKYDLDEQKHSQTDKSSKSKVESDNTENSDDCTKNSEIENSPTSATDFKPKDVLPSAIPKLNEDTSTLNSENETCAQSANNHTKNSEIENNPMSKTESESKNIHPLIISKVDENGSITIEESDDYLLYLEEILKIIHAKFFERYEQTKEMPDLKQIIPETRATILRDVKIVFSGIIPNRIKLEDSPAYKIARSLGGTVTQNIEADTTHLVALRAGTAKVHAASKRKNIKLVTPEWLWTCAERWEKVDERLFPLENSKLNTESRNPPAHCRSPDRIEPPLPIVPQISKVDQQSPDSGFLFSINPLMSLSSEDIESMEGEVEDICKESDDENESDKETTDVFGQDANSVMFGKKRKLEKNDSSSSSLNFRESDEDDFESTESAPKKRKRIECDDLLDESSTNIENEINDRIDDDDVEDEQDSDDETINEKFRRGEGLPSDLDIDYNTEEGTDEEQESDGEWNVMGAALEREFLEED